MSILLVTHDLSVIAEMCDRVLVMYAGRIVEDAPTRQLFAAPQHPYTQQLIRSIPAFPRDGRRLHTMTGEVPDLSVDVPHCAFEPRCEQRIAGTCDVLRPDLLPIVGMAGQTACHAVATSDPAPEVPRD